MPLPEETRPAQRVGETESSSHAQGPARRERGTWGDDVVTRCRRARLAVSCIALLCCAACSSGSAAPASLDPIPSATPRRTDTVASARAPRLIQSAGWVRRGGRPSLQVIPTCWQRDHRDDATIATAWRRIVQLRPDADRPGMRDQYACHVRFAPTKAAFYLEPWRPDVGYLGTVAQACNPGGRKDLG